MDLSSGTSIATSTARQSLAGAVIAGKYRLDELLGEGSQGMVWRAHNLDLDLPVAVKLMHPLSEAGVALGPNRLFREARAAATLGHPGIVRIFDFGRTSHGLPYLAMELLHGVSLARHLEREGTLSPELAVRLVLPIADALAAAHAQGIVHRDVKPDNILLSVSSGLMQPKLLDFGIARVADGQHLTQAGSVVGTPNYLPPEQARGLEEVDERADIWALCATLYECVTGVVPFAAPTWIDVLRRIIDDEPEPIAAHGVEDPELWGLIQKGLAKDPHDRWSSMQEFACAASRWLLDRGVRCDICGVSVESRWLRPPSASVADGATANDIGTWWADEPTTSVRHRRARRRRILGWSAPLLCVAATIAVTTAGAWVFKTPARSVSHSSLALQSAPARPVSPDPEVLTIQAAPDVNERNTGANSGETLRPGSTLREEAAVVGPARVTPPPPTNTTLLPNIYREQQPPTRRVAPPKPAAAAALDTLDLMDPY